MADKNINDIPRDVRTLYTKAIEATQRENLDYAITLFNQALEKEPGFTIAARRCARRNSKNAAAAADSSRKCGVARAPRRRSPRPKWP